jgi:tetratricopeptide (TPR) repeat protein
MSRSGAQHRAMVRPSRTLLTALAAVAFSVVLATLLVGCGGSGKAAEARQAEQAGDLSAALALYQERLQSHPDDVEAVKAAAGILYVERRWDEALPMQEKAVSLDPKEAQIRVELGFNYLNHQDDPAGAVAVLEEASKLEPTAQYLSFLAQAQMAAGDGRAAEATLRRALAEDKTYPRAYALLIALLEQQGRADEAADVEQSAQSAGLALQPDVSTP